MITFDIHRDDRLIVCRAREAISVLDVANYLQALVRDPRFDPSYYALIIAADSGCVPPLSMLKFLNPLISAWTERRGNAKWALVLPDAHTKNLVEEELKRLTLHAVRTRCFTDEQ